MEHFLFTAFSGFKEQQVKKILFSVFVTGYISFIFSSVRPGKSDGNGLNKIFISKE